MCIRSMASNSLSRGVRLRSDGIWSVDCKQPTRNKCGQSLRHAMLLAASASLSRSRVQDDLKNALIRSDNQPTAVFGDGGSARRSTTTRRSISPFRNALRNLE
jgi:hypothetical protein